MNLLVCSIQLDMLSLFLTIKIDTYKLFICPISKIGDAWLEFVLVATKLVDF